MIVLQVLARVLLFFVFFFVCIIFHISRHLSCTQFHFFFLVRSVLLYKSIQLFHRKKSILITSPIQRRFRLSSRLTNLIRNNVYIHLWHCHHVLLCPVTTTGSAAGVSVLLSLTPINVTFGLLRCPLPFFCFPFSFRYYVQEISFSSLFHIDQVCQGLLFSRGVVVASPQSVKV